MKKPRSYVANFVGHIVWSLCAMVSELGYQMFAIHDVINIYIIRDVIKICVIHDVINKCAIYNVMSLSYIKKKFGFHFFRSIYFEIDR